MRAGAVAGGGVLLLLSWCANTVAPASGVMLIPSGVYEVTTETTMPNLEESLRYTTTRETRCLARQAFSGLFAILDHPSLEGCELGAEQRTGKEISYRLLCDGDRATGSAVWRIADRQVAGTLRIKLGGKNMTLTQRVTAKHLRSCE